MSSSLTVTQFKIYYKTTGNTSGTSDTTSFILDVAYDPTDSNKVKNIFSSDVSPKGDIGLIVGSNECGTVNLGSNQITLFMNQIPTLNGISTTKIPSESTVPYEYYALTATTITNPGTVTSFKIQGWNGSAFVNIFTTNSASINNSNAYVYANPVTTVTGVTIDGSNLITDLPDYDAATQNPILADLVNLGYTRTQIFNLVGSSTSNLNTVITYFKNEFTASQLRTAGFTATDLKTVFTARELYNNGANGYYTLFELKTAFTLAQMYDDALGISTTILYNKANVGTLNASDLTSYLTFLYTTPISGSFYTYPNMIYNNGGNGWTLSDMKQVATITELITGNSRNTASNSTTVGGIAILNFTFNNVNGISLTDIKTAIRAGQLYKYAGWTILQLYGSAATASPPAGYYSLSELYNQTVVDPILITDLKTFGFKAAQLYNGGAGLTVAQLYGISPDALGTRTNNASDYYTIAELYNQTVANPIPVSALKTYKFTSVQLYNSGAGLTIADLYGVGVNNTTIAGAAASGYFAIGDFKTDNMPASALKTAGFTSVRLYNTGTAGFYSIADLYGVGNGVSNITGNAASGYFSIMDFKTDNMPASALKTAGFTSVRLYNSGTAGYYSIADLYGVGNGVSNITGAAASGYFSIIDFKGDSMPVSVLKIAGFTSVRLYNSGTAGYYSIADLYGVGNGVSNITGNAASGYFAIGDFKTDNMPASALRGAGFTASQVYNGGYNTLLLLYGNSNNAQGSPASGYYLAEEICAKSKNSIAGISVTNLQTLGFNALQIFMGGISGGQTQYTLQDMDAAGLTPADFNNSVISSDLLFARGWDPLELLNDLTTDYTVLQLFQAGFSLTNFRTAGVSAFYLQKAYPTIQGLITAYNTYRVFGGQSNNNISVNDLLLIYNARELTGLYLASGDVGFGVTKPNNYAYYTIANLKERNVTPNTFRTSPLTFYPYELIAGGYTLPQLWSSDSNVNLVNTSGYFTAADFKADSNITMASLVQANFKPSLLLSNAYSLIELWNGTSGQTPSTYYSAQKFRLADISVQNLLSANFKASLLHDNGNGYSLASLYPTYTLQRFFNDGITIAQLYSGNMLTSSVTPGPFTALQLYTVGSADSSYRNFSSLKTDGLFSAQEIYAIMQTLSYTYQRSRSELLSLGYTDANISLLIEPQQLQSVICFPAKTPVKTDQGYVHIDKIDKRVHTIRGEKIVAITKTVSKENHLVCIKKNALAKNMPSEKTYISKNHCVLYKGKMVEAKKLVALIDNGLVEFVEYTGETLYNVLLEEHSKIIVNNMICETLHPFNKIAIFHTCTNFYNVSELEQQILVEEFNKIEKQMMNMRR